jgi:hypothetical protein
VHTAARESRRRAIDECPELLVAGEDLLELLAPPIIARAARPSARSYPFYAEPPRCRSTLTAPVGVDLTRRHLPVAKSISNSSSWGEQTF